MVSLRLTAVLELGVGLEPRMGKLFREAIGDDIESFSIRMLFESCRWASGRIEWPLPESFGGALGASSLLRVCR